MARARAFLATSLDGFVAGPDDELDWLAPEGGTEDTFTPFFAEIGAMLMGRRTYEVVSGFDGWPYGDTPVLVATTRPLDAGHPTVEPIGGTIAEMVEAGRARAGDRDLYVDGGALVRSALQAGVLDELTLTIVPIALGAGRPLLAGLPGRQRLELVSTRAIGGGLVEIRYRVPRRRS